MGDIGFKMNTYTQLINKHEGENCFIYGAGPSIYYHMYNSMCTTWTWLFEYGIRIAVNSSILAETEPDYWISND